MRLAAFIKANIEAISVEWERFAADMDEDQTEEEQHEKSEDHPDRSNFTQGAVVQHALARVQMGLSARQFISEFRALRATVIRLWQRDTVEIDSASLNDMIRFNEAIDQVLGEGAITYTEEVDRSRELFLSILGHDLRNPSHRDIRPRRTAIADQNARAPRAICVADIGQLAAYVAHDQRSP